MKGVLRVVALGLLAGLSASAFAADKEAKSMPFAIYEDGVKDMPYIWSGWMGNTGAMKIDEKDKSGPHSGETALKFTYSANDGWGGIVWQSPANDWGDQDGGFNLSNARKLTFWAKGGSGGEKVDFLVGIIGSDKKFPDSDKAELKGTELTTEWKQYEIDLEGLDLSQIKTGFGWVVGGQGKPITVYFDDIRFE